MIDFYSTSDIGKKWAENAGFNILSQMPTKGLVIIWQNQGPAIFDTEQNNFFNYQFEDKEFWRRIHSSLNDSDLLIRAVGAKKNRPSVFDCTFGLGRDAFQLATWGCTVLAAERNLALYSLAKFYLDKIDLEKPQLHFGSAEELTLSENPEVVYYDPMFQEEKSALAQKPMQLLQKILSAESSDSNLVLDKLAIKYPKARFVIKRSLSADKLPFSDKFHNFNASVAGKSIRFDIYLGK